MLAFASTVTIPVWLAPVLVGVTVIGTVANTINGVIADLISLRKLEQLDAQRVVREEARHQEIMTALQREKL